MHFASLSVVMLHTCCDHTDHTLTVAQARANRGILYVDEVNLLDDGLVDVVLDSAASGLNTVEREGVSIIHPAKFIMLGSGNPQVPRPPIPMPSFLFFPYFYVQTLECFLLEKH